MNKQKRYYDKSKVNIFFLLNHSINIISVFNRSVFRKSIILGIILFFIGFMINIFIFYIPIIFIIIFNIFISYNKRKMSLFLNDKKLIKSIKKYKN